MEQISSKNLYLCEIRIVSNYLPNEKYRLEPRVSSDSSYIFARKNEDNIYTNILTNSTYREINGKAKINENVITEKYPIKSMNDYISLDRIYTILEGFNDNIDTYNKPIKKEKKHNKILRLLRKKDI